MPAAVKRGTIHAGGLDIGIYTTDYRNEYISLTDIAKYRSIDPRVTIHNWLRGRDIVEFLGLWEVLHNPGFKRIEFDTFKENAGTNAFVFSIKDWTEKLGAIGLLTKSGRYGGGIYAHADIAFEFASWISPEFKLYIIKDYQRLKYDENSRLSLSWNLNREIAKLNYHIHTDAIKQNLLPPDLTPEQISCTYASEADVINVALFGMTAKQWREANPGEKGNMRDYASLNQLLVLANMESYNALLIEQKKEQAERLTLLRELAMRQMKTLSGISLEKLPRLTEET
ncbi:MAG: KilA-N domain-containing protein [Clostridia bacterium]|nr:KilA-N domain-containing protein [Clostridia bacterium]